MSRFWTAAADLFVGADCPGCGEPALTWCRDCAHQVRPDPRAVDVRGMVVPVAAAGSNADVLRALLVAWKESGRNRLTPPLAVLLAAAVCHLDPPVPLTLVPVPSDPRAVRRRGADVVADLADGAALVLSDLGIPASASPVLRRIRHTRDQVGLDVRERRQNIRDAFDARPGAGRVVVVDDILTSGSTAREAVRALAAAGWSIAGVAVVGHTPAPS